MAGYDGSIRINTSIDQKGFERGARSLTQGMTRLGKSLSGMVSSLGIGLGIAGLVALGKQAIDTASDIQEVQNVVDTSFGDMSYKMEELAKTSVKQFGISSLSAKQMGSTFMAMGSSMVGDMGQASDMAINLTKRAADMASFYNKSAKEVAIALQGIYTGETEVLKQYGVVQTEVNLQEFAASQGINKKISAMTQAEKVQLRYNYVMQQTALSAGDFAKTSGSWANQTRILSEQFKELLSILGSGLIAVLTPAIKALNSMLTSLIAIAKQIGAILSKLFGISIPVASAASGAAGIASDMDSASDSMGSAADNAGDLEKGVKKAGKAAKGALASFDKLNVLSKEAADSAGSDGSSGSGGGGGTGGGGTGSTKFPTVEMNTDEATAGLDAVMDKIQLIVNKLKELAGISFQGFLDGLGDWKTRLDTIKTSLSSIWQSLKEIFTDPEVLAAADTYVKSVARVLGTFAGSVASIGLTIATNIVGGIEKYLKENKDRIKKYLVNMFEIWTEVNNLFSKLFTSIAYIFEAFASEQGQQFTANIIGIFTSAFGGVTTLVSKIFRDIAGIIIKPFVDNKEAFRTALEGFLGVLSSVTGTVKTGIQSTFDSLNKTYDTHLKPFFDSVASGVSSITGKFLDFWNVHVKPMLDSAAKGFDKLWKSHLQPLLNKASGFIGKVADLLKTLWQKWIQPLIEWIVQNVLPKILPILESLWNGVRDRLGNIMDRIKGMITVIGGIIDFLTGVFSGDWSKAWDGIKSVFSGIFQQIKAIAKERIDSIKNVIITGVNILKGAWQIAWSAVKSIASTAWGNIKKVFTAGKGVGGWFKDKFEDAATKMKNAFKNPGEFFGGVWKNIKGAFGNISGWFKDKFSAAWKAVKDVFSTGGKIFNGIKDGILSGLKTVINGLIDGINKVIRVPFNGINAALGKIKGISIAGKKPFDFLPTIRIPQIPPLANGAVIRGGDPFLAVLGDQRRGQTNIETPLPTMVKAFKQALAESGGTEGDISVRVYLGEKDITQAVKTEADMYFKRTGQPLFNY